MDLKELIAREQIREVKARYCRTLDTKDWDSFGKLFTDEAILDVREDTGSPPFQGRDAIVDAVRRVCDRAKSSHHVHSPEFTFHGADSADVIWAMHDRVSWDADASPIPPITCVTGEGHYRERYEQADGAWRIASLRLTRLHVERQ